MGGSDMGSARPGAHPLAKIQQALRSSNYRDAISAAAALPTRDLAGDQLHPLMDAMLTAAAGLKDDSEDEVRAYNLVVGLGEALRGQEKREAAVEIKIENALFNKGVVLGRLGRSEEAIAVYDDLLRRYGGLSDPSSREHTARALFNKGARLADLNRPADALTVYGQLLERFGQSTEPKITEAVAKAMVNRGIALGRLRRYDEAVVAFDDVLILWADERNPFLQERVALALLNKATALMKLGRPEGTLASYEELVRRFANDRRPQLQRQVSIAKVLIESVRSGLGYS